MPNENLPANLPQPPDPFTTPPGQQADGQRESGPAITPLNPMPPPAATSAQNPSEAPERLPYWLRQSERFLRVVVRMYLGLLVCCAPWYPPAWDANPLFSSSPHLLAFITDGAVRGLVSGLGLLNLWIALRDALRNPADPSQQ
jgi:hypothetical protein